MEKKLLERLKSLEKVLSAYPSALIAFSGGVDSTLLAYVCKNVIGQNTLLVTATSSTYPESEL
ncbi:MAG: TIGR00268 family protein, partial [Fibrobacter sp.]|nr:TIGR00268 family protein [Fibrobacter sp.]